MVLSLQKTEFFFDPLDGIDNVELKRPTVPASWPAVAPGDLKECKK